jgi:hypothetical protein
VTGTWPHVGLRKGASIAQEASLARTHRAGRSIGCRDTDGGSGRRRDGDPPGTNCRDPSGTHPRNSCDSSGADSGDSWDSSGADSGDSSGTHYPVSPGTPWGYGQSREYPPAAGLLRRQATGLRSEDA